ncbi:unnamed protein product [Oppiella nova]|uniref:Major facilitator superfamily (MFS) profile domain-containing protein n=1 Tax=Oppiella nova TaxID=334625 RepID=A0A7R9QUA5_9ACAR|nr:unnamed protein product [Oppiella nova]CAG2174633.1 unnamed protein product [Oppiella nova]
MDFEDILQEVGDFGFYQKRLVVLYLIAAGALLPFFCMTTLFMISSPNHWCKVWQLSNYSFEQQIQLISPAEIVNGVPKYDSCNMYDIDYNYLAKVGNISIYKWDKNLTDFPVKPCHDGWAFDNTNYEETAVTALNLFCDRSHYVNLILSVGNIGTIIGTPLFGWLSDKIGRKRTFQITVFVFIISSLSPTLLRDLNSFLIFRIINGFILPSFYQLPYIILIESVGPRSRTCMNSIACLAWVGGSCLLPLVAYLTRHWVTFNIVTSSAIIVFFFYWKLLPESPRWLIINEKYTEAEKLLLEMAEANGKPKPTDLIQKLKSVGKQLTANDSEKVNNAIMVFLKKPGLRKNLILVTVNWMCCAAVYFGIQLNLYNFSGNEFLNFFLLAVIELPAYVFGWYLIETRMGRRWSYSLFLILCGLSLCVPAFVPDSYAFVTNIMAMVGKFCTTISFMVVYQQAAEIYPTAIRNQGMGVGSMASSVVGMVMPFLTFSVKRVWLSLFVMGVISIIIGGISTLLPETLNVNLPQTIEEGNIFGKNRKYLSWANTKTVTKIDKNANSKDSML